MLGSHTTAAKSTQACHREEGTDEAIPAALLCNVGIALPCHLCWLRNDRCQETLQRPCQVPGAFCFGTT